MNEAILDQLRTDLTRPRRLTSQVRRHLASNYGVADDEIVTFLERELPHFEEFQVELLFGPLFTPSLDDRARYSDLLGENAPEAREVEALIDRLRSEGLACPLELDSGETFRLIVTDVLSERYVGLLYLDHPPGAVLRERVIEVAPPDDRDLVLATLREEVWQEPSRRQWLSAFLEATAKRESFSLAKLNLLGDLLRGRAHTETSRVLDLARSLLEDRRRHFVEVGPTKPFFARHIEEWHGHGRDQRRSDPEEIESHQLLLDRLGDLVLDLESMAADG